MALAAEEAQLSKMMEEVGLLDPEGKDEQPVVKQSPAKTSRAALQTLAGANQASQ